MRLFHFSDEPGIAGFAPRPVNIPVARRQGYEWLNGPLVWAIDEAHQPLYLFPRECPRILLWCTARTSDEDRVRWFGASSARMIAFIEDSWVERHASHTAYRYELPSSSFEELGDAGMWVSREAVVPVHAESLVDLPAELRAQGVELRACASLLPLKPLWRTSLHASGIRLRNVAGWGAPGWPHSPADSANR